MSFSFSKDWTNSSDFSTYEGSEEQVRADMQYLFDEIKSFINSNGSDGLSAMITQAVSNQVSTLQNIQANVTELNALSGAGCTNADFVKLHALTATSAEINKLDDLNTTKAELETLHSSGITNTDLVNAHNFFSGGMTDILNAMHPVGSIMLTINSANPNTYLPGFSSTTWELVSAGKFLMGVDSDHAVGTTGGAFTKTIAEANLPAHTHGLNSHTHTVGAHNHGLNSHTHSLTNATTASAGSHNHLYPYVRTFQRYSGSGTYNDAVCPYDGTSVSYPTASSGSHIHSLSGDTDAAAGNTTDSTAFNSGAATGNTASTGSGTALDVTNPYFACYMWKRLT